MLVKRRIFHLILTVFIMSITSKNAFGQNQKISKDTIDVLSIINSELDNHSVLNEGDLTRIKAVLAKAESGEDIVIGAIGGSITMGAVASTPTEGRWANRVAQWFRDKYPFITVRFYNAGIGATNSTYGALRAYTDLLQYRPDLVLFEFSINDSENDHVEQGAEGLLREILNAEQKPALIMLAMMNESGGNVQEKHLPLAQYYNIPFVSFRNVFEPLIKDKSISPKQILADAVHPNKTGHEMAGRIIQQFLEKAWQSRTDNRIIANSTPKPLYSDKFENVTFFRASELKFGANKGWDLLSHKATEGEPWRMNGKRIIEKVWNAKTPGSKLQFNYKGTFFSLTYFLYKAADLMGFAKVIIDGKEYATINGTGKQTWGGYSKTVIIGDDLRFGKHQVTIELLPGKDSRTAGNGFDIIALAYGNK